MNILHFFFKYIQKTFEECLHLQKTNYILKNIANIKKVDGGLPNIVLYGGSGKYTRLMITLKTYLENNNYSNDPYKMLVRAIDSVTGSFVQLPTSKNKPKNRVIFAMVSQVHCEIDLNQAGADKTLIPFLEYYSKSKNINLGIQKYIILRNIKYLKRRTQNSLRRIIETSQSNIRFLITISSLTSLIDPLRSRFLCVSLAGPNLEDSTKIIKNILQYEKKKKTNKKILTIIEQSKKGSFKSINLKELLLTLEGSLILKNQIYITEKNEAVDLLVKVVKKGNREEIRSVIYKIYELMRSEFTDIITCDFFGNMLHLKDIDIKKFISLTEKWNVKLNQDNLLEPIYAAEAYIFAVCELINI